MDSIKDQDVAVYAVWLPILGIDSKASLPFATKYFPDSRVRHYWDAEAELSRAYQPVFKTDETVWDVYMLYDRNAEWKDSPPMPVFIMDKIGLEVARPLDGVELANEMVRLRSSSPPSRWSSEACSQSESGDASHNIAASYAPLPLAPGNETFSLTQVPAIV